MRASAPAWRERHSRQATGMSRSSLTWSGSSRASSSARYPQVFERLLAIHRAQGKSLQQLRRNPTPQQIDVLGISFEKGGASVLADGYLVAGSLTAAQRECIFGFGVLTQLMDDLEDLPHNLANRFLTIFSQAGRQ